MTKFPLHMNGVDVYDLDALKKSFDIRALLKNRAKLAGWLKGADEEEYAQKVKALSFELSDGAWLDAVARILGTETELANARKLMAEELQQKRVEDEARKRLAAEKAAEKARQAQKAAEEMTPEKIALREKTEHAMELVEKTEAIVDTGFEEDLVFALKKWRYFAVTGELVERIREILSLSPGKYEKIKDLFDDVCENNALGGPKEMSRALNALSSIEILSEEGIRFAIRLCRFSGETEVLDALYLCTLLDEEEDIILLESTYQAYDLREAKTCLNCSFWKGARYNLESKGYCSTWKGEVSPSSPCSSWTPCE